MASIDQVVRLSQDPSSSETIRQRALLLARRNNKLDKFVRDSFRFIEQECDREALNLIGTAVLTGELVGLPGGIHEVFERLARLDDTDYNKKLNDWQDKYYDGAKDFALRAGADLEQALHEYQDLSLDERMKISEAAYLLGIAVGRRLGSSFSIGGRR